MTSASSWALSIFRTPLDDFISIRSARPTVVIPSISTVSRGGLATCSSVTGYNGTPSRERAAFLVVSESVGDQKVGEGFQWLIQEYVDVFRDTHVSVQNNGDSSDDQARNRFPAHQP